MGTRGAFGYRIDGADKVAYNHFDSYPDGLGRTMLEYIGAHTAEQMAEAARRIVLVGEDESPPPEMVDRYARYANRGMGWGVDNGKPTHWYTLLREAQGEPKAFHDGLDHMIDGAAFLADSLFCEWAYIVNLDDGALEVYRGFQRAKGKGRYAHLHRKNRDGTDNTEYFGVSLLDAVPLDKLRGLSAGDVQALCDRWEKLASPEGEE